MDRELKASERHWRLARRAGWAGGAVFCVVALLILLPGWLRPTVSRERIRFGQVDRGTIEAVIQASGSVVPSFEAMLSSPVEARVEKILRRPGEMVAAGEAILRLDSSSLSIELGRLDDLLRKKVNEQEQLSLELDKKVAALRGRIATGRLDLEALEYRADQNRKLRAEGLVSELVARAAEVEARKARIEVEQLEAQAAGEQRSTAAMLAGVELDFAILRRDRAEALRQIELATPRAASPGVLTWVVPQEGATVRKGEAIARIADPGSYRVEAKVSDVHSARLEAGQPVRVVIDGETIGGRLAQVLPAIEGGAVKFVAELDDPRHPKLRNNLSVEVLVVFGVRRGVLRAPRGPYAAGAASEPVFVLERDGASPKRRAVRRQVHFGLLGYQHFEVLDGLQEGDEIVVSDLSEYLHLSFIDIR